MNPTVKVDGKLNFGGKDDEVCVRRIDFPKPLDLSSTLMCGQAFRWRPMDFGDYLQCSDLYGSEYGVSFLGSIKKTGIVLSQDSVGITVFYDSRMIATDEIDGLVGNYLSLDDDIEVIGEELRNRDPVISKVIDYCRGLRVLRQDPWECLASYILSIQKNIPAISGCVEYLAKYAGVHVGLGQYAFPSPEQIARMTDSQVRKCKCGFRAGYLKDAAEKICEGVLDLNSLSVLPTQEARKELMKVKGVGPKVADCVLLFGYHRLEVFPVDVWVARAMSKLYFNCKALTPEQARAEGIRRFGDFAGYAQEYLFHFMRTGM